MDDLQGFTICQAGGADNRRNRAWLQEQFVATIRAVLDGLETVFVDAPWPVVMTVIVVVAWRLAGPRVAVFTAAALAYLAL